MDVSFEGYCQDGSIQVSGPFAPSIESSANQFATLWNELCGDTSELPEIITWSANDGQQYSTTNVPFGFIIDNDLVITPGSTAWTVLDNPEPEIPADPSLSFLAACGLVLCYGLGLIGGQQR